MKWSTSRVNKPTLWDLTLTAKVRIAHGGELVEYTITQPVAARDLAGWLQESLITAAMKQFEAELKDKPEVEL